ncbi:MAG TPA: S53 family peptidase [Candidatus Acidoferrales bacterium]|nr:S53 family peptidase [Candidatus Acidoferrales bacterium]
MKPVAYLAPLAAVLVSTSGVAGAQTRSNPEPSIVAGTPVVRFADMGPVAPSMPVRLTVVLKNRNEPDLEALSRDRSDPQSPLAGRALTVEQFRNYFAPTPQAYASAMQTFVREGFRIERTYATGTVFDVVGTAAAVDRTFNTVLHRARTARFLGYANVTPAYLPAALASSVAGVAGFDDLPKMSTYLQRSPRRMAPLALGGRLQGPDTGYSPYAFADAYNFPSQHRIGKTPATYDGTGQAAAIVIDSDFKNSDLAGFLRYFKIKRTGGIVRVDVDGGPADPSGFGEATLDVETLASLVPGATVYLYLIPTIQSSQNILDAYAQINSDDKVGVVNNSFGGCESTQNPANFPGLTNVLAREGNALGITYVAATGDEGAQFLCPPKSTGSPDGVSTPASGTYFTAVGATTLFLKPDGQYLFEYGWSGTGGGYSVKFPMPSFQDIPRVRSIAYLRRTIPDISFDGDPGSGASWYIDGGWEGPIGGTSLSSPIFCALVTQWNQMKNARITGMNAGLYSAFQTFGYAKNFTDITFGNNYYNARPGYDLVTGIGSIDGWNFAKAALGV